MPTSDTETARLLRENLTLKDTLERVRMMVTISTKPDVECAAILAALDADTESISRATCPNPECDGIGPYHIMRPGCLVPCDACGYREPVELGKVTWVASSTKCNADVSLEACTTINVDTGWKND